MKTNKHEHELSMLNKAMKRFEEHCRKGKRRLIKITYIPGRLSVDYRPRSKVKPEF